MEEANVNGKRWKMESLGSELGRMRSLVGGREADSID